MVVGAVAFKSNHFYKDSKQLSAVARDRFAEEIDQLVAERAESSFLRQWQHRVRERLTEAEEPMDLWEGVCGHEQVGVQDHQHSE